jgi:hypothetical protein
MRIPDELLNCVVFVGQTVQSGSVESVYLGGTGFIVSFPSERFPGSDHLYLVTAKHVVDELAGRRVCFRLNSADQNQYLLIPAADRLRWWFHPDKPDSVDVAVTPWRATRHPTSDKIVGNPFGPVANFGAVPPPMFVNDQVINDYHIGPGDEVVIIGLFTKLEGKSKNHPIVRIGNLAMMPDDYIPRVKIGNWVGESPGYLIEARSIGGLSGSPVFVRVSAAKEERCPYTNQPFPFLGTGPSFLLGLTHGHWSIKAEDKNEVRFNTTATEDRVNMGIAIVVPAYKILEVLNHPELVADRRRAEEEVASADKSTPG